MNSAGTLLRVDLSPALREELEHIVREGPPNLARHARIVLDRADGASLSTIAATVDLHRDSVRRWLVRFRGQGVGGLQHRNTGKSKNVVFHADVCDEILRRAGLPPRTLGESFEEWSLYKLRDHVIRRGLVQSISVERLRHLMNSGQCSRRYWRRPTIEPLSPQTRSELVALVQQPHVEPARRARAVLAVADGASVAKVASTLRLRRTHLARWIMDFRAAGVAGLIAPRR